VQGNSRYHWDVSPGVDNTQQVASDDASEDEYDTADDESPPGDGEDETRVAPRAATSANSAATAQYSVSSSSSSLSHDSSCSTSSSTPLTILQSGVRLTRTDSVASAPPSTKWSDRAPANQRDNGRRSTVTDVLPALARGISLPAAASPRVSGPRSSRTAPARIPPRKPNLNRNPRAPRALLCLTLSNPLRKLCIKVVELKYPLSSYD